MFKPCPSRWFYFSQFLVVIGLLAFAILLQWYKGLVPCALCEIQRWVFALLGLFFLIGAIFKFKRLGQLGLNGFISLIAVFGMALAGRQVWLQYWPPPAGSSSCDASLYYLLQIMPWTDAFAVVFIGGPECAKVTWQFLSLGIAQWSLLWFAVFFMLAWWQLVGFFLPKRRGT